MSESPLSWMLFKDADDRLDVASKVGEISSLLTVYFRLEEDDELMFDILIAWFSEIASISFVQRDDYRLQR